MRERVERARGGPLEGALDMSFAAEVTQEESEPLVLVVRTRTEGAGAYERRVAADDCEELVEALVHMVSLALGPHVSAPSVEEARAPEQAGGELESSAQVSAEAAPPPAGEGEPLESEPSPEESTTLLLALMGILDGGSFGPPALGAMLEPGVRVAPSFELRMLLGYFPPQSLEAGRSSGGAGGRWSLALTGFTACAGFGGDGWRVPLCGGLELGRWMAEGTGVQYPNVWRLLWLAGRLEVRAALDLPHRFALGLLGGVALPLLRHELLVDGTPLHRVPRGASRMGLSLERAF